MPSRLPARERVISLLVVIGLVQAVGLGAFFAFVLGLIYSNGGTVTLDIQHFGEAYFEYWLMVILVPILTLTLFYALELLPSRSELS